MVQVLAERSKPEIPKRTIVHTSTGVYELVVFCPQCKALETLCFDNGSLMQTRKFNQTDGQVYHDCGSNQPCRLYRSF